MSEHEKVVPQRGIIITCEGPQHHQQTIYLPDHTREQAELLGGIMDGTSSFYRYPPRESPLPGSMLAKCGICGAWFRCEVFGYPELN